jgi:hypothetical protein
VVPDGGISLEGYAVPEGIEVETQAYSLHRDPNVLPDPLTYVPCSPSPYSLKITMIGSMKHAGGAKIDRNPGHTVRSVLGREHAPVPI